MGNQISSLRERQELEPEAGQLQALAAAQKQIQDLQAAIERLEQQQQHQFQAQNERQASQPHGQRGGEADNDDDEFHDATEFQEPGVEPENQDDNVGDQEHAVDAQEDDDNAVYNFEDDHVDFDFGIGIDNDNNEDDHEQIPPILPMIPNAADNHRDLIQPHPQRPQQQRQQQHQQPQQPEAVTVHRNNWGREVVARDGFVYQRHCVSKRDESLAFYRCELRVKNNCHARVHVRDGQIVMSLNQHNHAPNGQRGTVMDAIAEVKDLARETRDPTNDIIRQATETLPGNVQAQLPTEGNLKRTIQRARFGNAWPALPNSLAELELPDELIHLNANHGNELFLKYDSGPATGNNRILIFCTQQNLDLLRLSNHWHSDGTFSDIPRILGQVYTIHSKLHGTIVPLVYFFLPRKDRATYVRAFQALKNLEPRLEPGEWMIDFEVAAIGAILEVFPNVNLSGCFFHYTQCLWRKLQSEGLQNVYAQDEIFAIQARQFSALALVPVEHLRHYYDALQNAPNFDARLREFNRYFEQTWVGTVAQPSLFSPNMWNVRERTLMDEPRTNNNLEGWHSGFAHACKQSCHSIYRFVETLKNEHYSKAMLIEQLQAGHPPRPPRHKYAIVNARLKRVVQAFDQRVDPLDYLRRISHNIRY